MNITTDSIVPQIDEYGICIPFVEYYPYAFGGYDSFEDCFEDFMFNETA